MNNTLICTTCDNTLIGDEPAIHTTCDCCEAYPDGWTCIECGDEFLGEFPADLSEGTLCKNCHESS